MNPLTPASVTNGQVTQNSSKRLDGVNSSLYYVRVCKNKEAQRPKSKTKYQAGARYIAVAILHDTAGAGSQLRVAGVWEHGAVVDLSVAVSSCHQ